MEIIYSSESPGKEDRRWMFNTPCGGFLVAVRYEPLVIAVYHGPRFAITGIQYRSTVISLYNMRAEGNTKLNVDGCWYNAARNAGIGGIFWDNHGTWTLGFYGKLNADSSTEAEIWSIYRGLTIILERGLSNVDIESDSLVAVNIINAGNPGNHPQSIIINDANMLLHQTGSKLTHIFRAANQCADHLARMGAEQNDSLVVLDQAPISIREFLLRDCLNIRQILD